ncbi:MAG: N-6 DNA methylase [Candidatus Lokiarchaeota archaeon]
MIKNVIFWYFKEFFPDMEVYPSNLDIPQIVKSFTVSKRKRALKNKLKTIKILDPSVGTGRFLLYISKLLLKIKKELNPSRNISTLKKEIIKYNLYGFDIDEKSCIITKIKLLKWLFQDEWNLNDAKILNFQILNDLIEQKDIKLNIYNSDFLLRSFGTQKFDIVIGNPPYVENKKISDKKYKKILYNEFKSAYKLFDLSILFIEKSIGLLKDSNSLLSFILQNKFLSAEYGSKVREFILNSCQVKNIINLSNINLFKGVSAYPIVLTLKKGNSGNKNLIELVSYEDFNFENQSNLRIQQFSQSLIQKLPKKVIPIEGNPEMVLSLYKSFNSMEREIKDLRIIYRPYGFLNYKKYLKNFSSKKI